MFGDIVMIVLALAVTGWLLSRLGGGARVDPAPPPPRATSPEPPAPARTDPTGSVGAVPPGGVASGPATAAGRRHDPWRDADADGAFVDGYIIGRYVERSRAEDERAQERDEALGGDDEDVPFAGPAFGLGSDRDLDAEDHQDHEDHEDEGADAWDDGFGDGLGDGFDDDW